MFYHVKNILDRILNFVIGGNQPRGFELSGVDLKEKFQRDLGLVHGNRPITAEDIFLNPEFSYFILQASFGDKWCILSFLHEFLNLQRKAKILANKNDRELIRIFVGSEILSESFFFFDDNTINILSSYFTPVSASTKCVWKDHTVLTQTDIIISEGFPSNFVRHLHLVKYPYLTDLHLLHGVSYAVCLRMILSLPSVTAPLQPGFYTKQDRQDAANLISSFKNNSASGFVLFNIYNISHQGFDENEILNIINRLEFYNIQVIVNVTGHPNADLIQDILDSTKMSVKVSIPAHLLGLVSENLNAVLGVVGGAMNVAVQFSSSHVLTFYTQGAGYQFPLEKLFGGHYNDNIWRLYDIDWPCLTPGRVVSFVDCSKSNFRMDTDLISSIDKFVEETFLAKSL